MFIFLSVTVTEFIATKSSVMEIQNIVVNSKSESVKSNSKQYRFLFFKSQQKSMTKFLKLMKKRYFAVIFAQRDFFLKTLTKCNCSGPPRIPMSKIQSRVEQYSITISMQKSFNQSLQFIKSFLRYTWFKSPLIYKALPIFDNVHLIIINVTFSFPKFVSACKN